MCVCLFVCEHISHPRTTRTINTIFVHGCESILRRRDDEIRRRRVNFRGLSGPFKSIDNLRCTGRCSVAAKGIFQSSITSCIRRDHSVDQASANSILKMFGRSRCGLGREEDGGIAQRGRRLIYTIALF